MIKRNPKNFNEIPLMMTANDIQELGFSRAMAYQIVKDKLLSLKYENVIEVIKTIKDKSINDDCFTVSNQYGYILSALYNSAATYSIFEK